MFPVITISGSARERGRMHGRLARGRVASSIATYARQFAYCGIGWQGAQALGANYRPVIGDFDPQLLEEIEGIAEGAGRAVNEILALNSRTEILPPTYPGEPSARWHEVVADNRAAGVPDWGECTAIAVEPSRSASGETLLAQNWDWLGMQRGALIVLRVDDSEATGAITLTEAGMLAKIGLNRHGFGVCLNLLRSKDDGAAPGVPVHVLLRALLGCERVADAVALASGVRHGGSSNVLCADVHGGVASLEISPRGLEVVDVAEAGALCHTNHFLMPGGRNGQADLAPTLSTVPRLTRIRELARLHTAPIGVADVQAMLCDESEGLLSICRRPDPALPRELRVETVASVVMELATGVMHIAPDVPTLAAYEAVGLVAESAVS